MISLLMLISCLGFSQDGDTTPNFSKEEKSILAASKLKLASAYLENDKLDEARASFLEALELDPSIDIAKEAIVFIDKRKENQLWRQTEAVDEMSGTKLLFLTVESQDRYTDFVGKRHHSNMVITCNEGKLSAWFSNNASADDAYDGVTIRVKFDEDKPISLSTYESTNGNTLFLDNPNALIAEFSQSNTMLYEFSPLASSPALLHFNVSGWDEKAASLKELCNLK